MSNELLFGSRESSVEQTNYGTLKVVYRDVYWMGDDLLQFCELDSSAILISLSAMQLRHLASGAFMISLRVI
jgi:hypothetical protein